MKCAECGRDNETRLLHWDWCGKHHEKQERRRYALLQAAAVIYAGLLHSGASDIDFGIDSVVTDAERLLVEIEKREKESQ